MPPPLTENENSYKNRRTLTKEQRQIIFNVHQYILEKSKTDENLPKNVQKLTAEATQASLSSVKRILAEVKSDTFMGFKTPPKKRIVRKPITISTKFSADVVRLYIYNYQIEKKEVPDTDNILSKLYDDYQFAGSERSVFRIIENIGFHMPKKLKHCERILIEKSDLRASRIRYLEEIKKYRDEGRPIIYTDEFNVWCKDFKKTDFCRDRVIGIHAGSVEGGIREALLMFLKRKVTAKDFHDDITLGVYEHWLQSQLIPNLPPRAVVVISNSQYHNKDRTEFVPDTSSKKEEMMKWLADNNVTFSTNMLRPELYELIQSHKHKSQPFLVDKVLKEYNFEVLRLPKQHPDLNAVTKAWQEILDYVMNKDLDWDSQVIMDLMLEKSNSMTTDDWVRICQSVKETEDAYRKVDAAIDKMANVLPMKNYVSSSESNSDDEDADSDKEDF